MKRFVAAALLAVILPACGTATTSPKVSLKKESKPVVAQLQDYGVVDALASSNLQMWVAAEQENARQAEIERQAEEARIAEEAARQKPQPVVIQVSSGGCCGPHSDAWWMGVAQCEQGGRNDPYFGYFSFMDGSQGGKPWTDQVAAGNALLARAGREIGPWAASCVAAGYANSPGG